MKQSHIATKKYLMKLRHLEQSVNHEMLEVARLRALATNISSVISSDRVQSSPSNRLEKTVLLICEQEKYVEGLIGKYLEQRKAIERQIDAIEDDECIEILKLYFMDGVKFNDLHRKANMSETKVKYVYNKGLELFHEINKDSYMKKD